MGSINISALESVVGGAGGAPNTYEERRWNGTTKWAKTNYAVCVDNWNNVAKRDFPDTRSPIQRFFNTGVDTNAQPRREFQLDATRTACGTPPP